MPKTAKIFAKKVINPLKNLQNYNKYRVPTYFCKKTKLQL